MKVFFDTVGCRLNQAEIESMAGQFRAAGYEIIDSPEGADLVVVNTCAVTAEAASDSRQKARQAYQAGAAHIILTGCWATLEPIKASNLPGVDEVVSNLNKMDIPLRVIDPGQERFYIEPLARVSLPGAHRRTRAFIKAQDGCDNHCTFCVTRLARGSSRSIPKEEVTKAVLLAEEGGVKEVVLSGVHLGSWGREKADGETITDLIETLIKKTSVERIRLSSIEPWDLESRFFDLWQNPRMCRHFHLPLQSGSVGVLKRMARHTTPENFSNLIDTIRNCIPDAAITTDIIVGFPGESDAEFEESLDFVKRMQFNDGHIFRFSRREGTAAARMADQVNGSVARERAGRMREVVTSDASAARHKMIGKEVKVLWEGSGIQSGDEWILFGLSDNNYRVRARNGQNRWNIIDRVHIEGIQEDDLLGVILPSD